ncbi:MAG: phosphogluconate dehydrogenase, partial [Agromyces sp.]|nr:phosphogluconate dehydrogenase [Agromyces sp.]
MRVAVLGLGEAGRIYAAELAEQGIEVTATDPLATSAPPAVTLASDIPAAVREAEIVLSLVGGGAAASALDTALPAMRPEALYADLNTLAPDEKRRLAARAVERGNAFVDVAVLAPVPRAGLRTPLALSGTGTERLRSFLEQLDVPTTDAGPDAGGAAGLKLLRSVFMKGLAALIFEAVTAAREVGAEEWVTGQIASELGPDGDALVQRLLEGTPAHAVRREAEMRDARAFLETLGTAHPMTDGTIAWLQALAARRDD